jgi:hypothetical protein
MKFKRLFALLLLGMGLIVGNAPGAVGAEGWHTGNNYRGTTFL